MKKLIILLFIPILLTSCAPAATDNTANIFWPQGQALPSFAEPHETLDAVDVSGADNDVKNMMTVLQGIVNRKNPRILVLNDDQEGKETWPQTLGLNYHKTEDYLSIVEKYSSEIKGLVIYDDSLLDTLNLATTIAGLENGIAVSPAIAETLTAAPYKFKIIKDLRNEKLTDKYAAYRYLHEEYWTKCSHRIIMGLNPESHNGCLRDLAASMNAAVLWLDPAVKNDKEILELFFADAMPMETFYTGWWPDEGTGIGYASMNGISTVPSDFFENYTVYSGQSRQLSVPAVPAKPKLESDKIYVSLYISDGDNIQYNQHVMRMNDWWGSSDRGKIPIGWTCTPALLDAAPAMLNYYLTTATENDQLVCGPSGLGYVSAEHLKPEYYEKYASLTNKYFEKTGMNIITVWHKLSDEKADLLSFPALLGLTTQDRVSSQIRFTSQNTPVVWLGSDLTDSSGAMSYDEGVGNIRERLTAAAKADSDGPQFYAAQVKSWKTENTPAESWPVSTLAALAEELNTEYPGRFVFVRPDHFMMLLNEANDKPYNLALRSAVTASDGSDAENITDGSISTGWQSDKTSDCFLQIDLGSQSTLSKYILKTGGAAGNGKASGILEFDLLVSDDGINWTSVDKVENNTESIVYRELSASGRYVRLIIQDAADNTQVSVQELEIYGVQ